MKHIFFVINMIFAFAVMAQKPDVFKIQNVYGVGYDSDLTKAKEKAINDAKINALRQGGIEENINSYSDLFKTEINDSYQELFSSQIFTDIRGTVKNVEIAQESKDFGDGDIIKCEVWINCEVIKYNTSADLLFTADIKGLKPFYYAGEFLTFSVKPTMNCWIYVFCIPQNEDESYTLLPNDWESAEMLQSDLIYNFPQNVDFELSVDLQIQQTDRLVFVITKQKYPLPAGLSYKKLFDWIFNIPPDQRFISSYNITISKKSE